MFVRKGLWESTEHGGIMATIQVNRATCRSGRPASRRAVVAGKRRRVSEGGSRRILPVRNVYAAAVASSDWATPNPGDLPRVSSPSCMPLADGMLLVHSR